MLKIGIIGCGKIADQHAEEIQKISDCEIVGVCDREVLMAKQMCERFNIRNHFTDVSQFLDEICPDVVHITTPPQSHYELGRLCLEAKVNIYIEKPFTLNAVEAEELVKLALEKKLKITVGHNAQFAHAAVRMRQLIRNGFLGGPPVHMESYYCYNFADERYAKSLLGDSNHWVRSLPGGLLHNIISHGISKIAEFFSSDSPTVIAHAFTSPLLRNINESGIVDELRVIISDNTRTTAYFTFSSQISPALHQFRIYGPKNALIIDDDHQIVIKIKGTKYKSYLDQFIPPMVYGEQYIGNAITNLSKFLRSDLHMNAGMKLLISSFYRSITDNTPVPIPYEEILLTSKIMDMIFEQVGSYQRASKVI